MIVRQDIEAALTAYWQQQDHAEDPLDHPAVRALLDKADLSTAPAADATRPLAARVDAASLNDCHIGYQVIVHHRQWTIATVQQLGYRDNARYGNGANVARLTFVEAPGYHYDVAGRIDVIAVVEPPEPPKPTVRPDLLDRDGDRWYAISDGRYMYSGIVMTRNQLDASHGPVRDA